MFRILMLLCLTIFCLQSFAKETSPGPGKYLINSKNFKSFSPVQVAIETPIGTTFQGGVGFYAETGSKIIFGQKTIQLPSTAVITQDNCSGQTVTGGNNCWINFDYSPVAEVLEAAQIKIHTRIEYDFDDNDGDGDGNHDDDQYTTEGDSEVNWDLQGIDKPIDSANPPPPSCQETKSASIVRVDAQSLGEHIPLVGTNFNLSYSSEFAASYQVHYGIPSGMSFFNPNGWTLDIQHFYQRTRWRLFKGSGTSEVLKYSRDGTVLNVPSADGSEVYVFSTTGQHLETKFGLTGARKYLFTYNSSDQLISVTDAFGNVTSFTYSGSGVTITAPFGQQTTITWVLWNSQYLYSSLTNPNGETFLFTYKTGTDLLETFTKPEGQVSTFSYSGTGKLTKDEGHGGEFWSLLESLGTTERTMTMSTAVGRQTEYKSSLVSSLHHRNSVLPYGQVEKYEEADNFSKAEGIEKVTTYKSFDPRFGQLTQIPLRIDHQIGNSVRVTDFSRTMNPTSGPFFGFQSITDTSVNMGHTTTSTYTSSNKTRVTTSPMGATSTLVINQFEQPLSAKTGNDTEITYSYDSFGRLAQTYQGTFNTITNSFGTNGLVANETNGRGEVTSYQYDLAGRVTQVTRPDTKIISFAFDGNGNLTGVTPPSRPQHVFEFNAFGLMSKYDPPALSGLTVKETLYSYNLDKQMTSIVRPDTQSVQYTYGASTGLLNQVTLARGVDTYSYVSNTNQVSQIDSADGIRSKYSYYGESLAGEEQRRSSDNFLYAVILNYFDTNHRLFSRAIRGGSLNQFAYVNYTYNNDDMPTSIGGMSLGYSYPSGRLESTVLGKISDARTYDSLGNLESYTASYNPTGSSPVVLYSYTLTRDIMSRIIGKSETIQGVTTTYVYSFDNVGRLVGVTKNGVTYSSYSYDDNGNRVSGSVNGIALAGTYDNQDRLLTYNSRTYSYNANGDCTGIQWTPTTQSTFTYDALGKLLATTFPGGSTSYSIDGRGNVVRIANGGTTLTRYIYDTENRIAGEFTDAGVMWRQFVYGTEKDSPDYLLDSTGAVRFIKDHLGSPRLLVKVSDGTVLQRMDYDEFGKVTANTNPTYQQFGFAGGLYLRLPGLVKFGARYYDAEVGRWSSKDPILFEGDDSNLYGYIVNDPINGIDPSGNLPEKIKDGENGYNLGIAAQRIYCSYKGCKLLPEPPKPNPLFPVKKKIPAPMVPACNPNTSCCHIYIVVMWKRGIHGT